jgi:hypothetical protein
MSSPIDATRPPHHARFSLFTQKLWRLLERIEGRSAWLVGAVSVLYLGVVGALAAKKPFWNDELFTFYISRRPTLADVWNALLTGAEQLPPLFFVITRAFTALFGSSQLAFRLPEIFGFWVMTLCLYLFVRKRSSAAVGLVAMVFPLITEGITYSYDARPYGLVLGFSALALVFWQAAAEGSRRGLSLIGLSVSLAAAISCHYYAVLVFFPLLLGETIRFFERKRVDLPVLAAIAMGSIPLGLFMSLILAARRYSGTFWAKPHWMDMLGFYYYLLSPSVILLACVPMLLAADSVFESNQEAVGSFRIPKYEIAAALGFALIPSISVFLAKTVTGAFTNRYALPAVIGVSILLAWSLFVLARNKAGPGLLVAFLGLCVFLVSGTKTYRGLTGWAISAEQQLQFLSDQRADGLPIVVADPHFFFELSYLAAGKGPPWLVYLADRELALKYTGTDDVELGLVNFKKWAPIDVEDFHQFTAAKKEFLIYGPGHGPGAVYSWIIPELAKEEWKFAVKGSKAGQMLLLARPPRDRPRAE